MHSLTFGEYTQKFFKDNEKHLKDFYPGLSINRLRQEFESYCIQTNINIDQLFENIYVPTHSNPIINFFSRLKEGVPLEYIRGRSYFYNSEFYVNSDVLIPRSETEILVELASRALKEHANARPRLLDVGVGSGAIVLSLLQDNSFAIEAVGSDISREALNVAKTNYFSLRYRIPKESELRLLESDRLNEVEGKFDVIVANPPYIKEKEDLSGVHKQVDRYEPHLALYLADEKYDEWFTLFFKQVYDHLNDNGVFLMEGHEDHLQQQKEMVEALGFSSCEVKEDYSTRDRFLVAKK